jgi:hypothetical protein
MVGVEYYSNSLNWSNYFYMNGFKGYLVSDELFNGSTFTFSAEIYAWDLFNNYHYYEGEQQPTSEYLTKYPIYANLLSVSKEFYDYVITRSKYSEAQNNPLAEPVNVFSNVKNGYGIFSSFSASQDSVLIKYE